MNRLTHPPYKLSTAPSPSVPAVLPLWYPFVCGRPRRAQPMARGRAFCSQLRVRSLAVLPLHLVSSMSLLKPNHACGLPAVVTLSRGVQAVSVSISKHMSDHLMIGSSSTNPTIHDRLFVKQLVDTLQSFLGLDQVVEGRTLEEKYCLHP